MLFRRALLFTVLLCRAVAFTRLARTVAVRTPQRLSSSMSDEPLSAKELRKELRKRRG